MSTTARREREVRQREQLIVTAARRLLLEHGFAGINMDVVAEAVDYSKGLLYKHFASKEDLLAAVSLDNHEKRTELFDRAAMFAGSTRERMTAIGVADETLALVYPEFQRTEQLLHVPSILEKCTPERRTRLMGVTSVCMNCVQGVARDAVATGDLVLPEGQTTAGIVFGLWTIALGAHTLHQSGKPLEMLGISNALAAMRDNQQKLLDGYDWKPLSSEHDYGAVRERVRQEVFAHEYGTRARS